MSDPQKYWSLMTQEMQRWKAPLYAHYCATIGQDEDLQALAAQARPGQPHGPQLFASIHYLLLRGLAHPLRLHYPNLNNGVRLENENPVAAFRHFCASHREELEGLVRTRSSNTNEIGRSAGLNCGFRVLAQQAPEPLHLIEVGPSAGLNLLWDRYQIRFLRGAEAQEIYVTTTPDAVLSVDVSLRDGAVPPLNAPPKVATRLGLELNPVDISDPDIRDWLRAMIPPDHLHRFARLEKALAANVAARPDIWGGDAIALLPEAIRGRPDDGTICVYHTHAVYQFSEAMKQSLEEILLAAGERRPVWRLANEWGESGGICPLILSHYHKGKVERQTLGRCDIHGNWLEWCG